MESSTSRSLGNLPETPPPAGHLPGTPKPPIDPPRRRSSLAFSRLLPEAHIADSSGNDGVDSPSLETNTSIRIPCNTSRKRIGSPRARSTATPGHVAQMQKLFQVAKDSLRFDMRFAASPVGSIGSRLPSDHIPSNGGVNTNTPTVAQTTTPTHKWRYSTAPGMLAEFDIDVREPISDLSPCLPDPISSNIGIGRVADREPLSSGYTSPQKQSQIECREPNSPYIPSANYIQSQDYVTEGQNLTTSQMGVSELEQPMTELRVASDCDMDEMSVDDSPIVAHLERRSRDIGAARSLVSFHCGQLFLSASARAAAESAKARRGLFQPPLTAENNQSETNAEVDLETRNLDPSLPICPNPAVHEYETATNPRLYYAKRGQGSSHSDTDTLTPPPVVRPAQHRSIPPKALLHPANVPFHRASSTGSPLPIAHIGPSPSPELKRCYHPPHFASSPPPMLDRGIRSYSASLSRQSPTMFTQHFQPGWYYARESPHISVRTGSQAYSFSTAAAKAIGQSPAPDSRIRDSYRTDTLTPLARPPSRYRKNGIGAMVNTRPTMGFSDDNFVPSSSRYAQTYRSRKSKRYPGDIVFRSSPPRGTSHTEPFQRKRRRTRDTLRTNFDHYTKSGQTSMPSHRLDDDEQMIEIDEDTRAAIRMSIYGPDGLDPSQYEQEVIRELSPNVTPWRKGSTMPRKKRRPSYWDGDLEEVRKSPAARYVPHTIQKKLVASPMDMNLDEGEDVEILLSENDLTTEVEKAGNEMESRLNATGIVSDQQNSKLEGDAENQ